MSTQPTAISDTYTGDLSQSPDPQRRTLDSATIVKLSVGPMDNNVYIVTSRATGDQLIIDAANDADRILATVAATGGRPALLFTTHHHFDHWQALTEVAAALKVPTAAGRLDAAELPVTPTASLTTATGSSWATSPWMLSTWWGIPLDRSRWR